MTETNWLMKLVPLLLTAAAAGIALAFAFA